jgi:hypothetical protein
MGGRSPLLKPNYPIAPYKVLTWNIWDCGNKLAQDFMPDPVKDYKHTTYASPLSPSKPVITSPWQ